MPEDKHDTKQRLLDAASKLFAGKRFDEVSIREIAAAAQVNVAAVNYHFQGKDNLYQQVILSRFALQRDKTLNALDTLLQKTRSQPDLEDVISTLVSLHLAETLLCEDGQGYLDMLAREMHASCTETHVPFFKEMVAPIFAAFSRALMLARPTLTQDELNWIIASIVSQIQHFILRWRRKQMLDPDCECLTIMTQVFPALGLSAEDYVQQVTDHITRFSTGAINALHPEAS